MTEMLNSAALPLPWQGVREDQERGRGRVRWVCLSAPEGWVGYVTLGTTQVWDPPPCSPLGLGTQPFPEVQHSRSVPSVCGAGWLDGGSVYAAPEPALGCREWPSPPGACCGTVRWPHSQDRVRLGMAGSAEQMEDGQMLRGVSRQWKSRGGQVHRERPRPTRPRLDHLQGISNRHQLEPATPR